MPLLNTPGFRSDLLSWFSSKQRDLPWRRTSDPYHIWVSEVMLQQTQVKTVIPYYHRFIERFPNVQGLAASELEQVLKLWEGLGYYSRARNLHRAAGIVVTDYQGAVPSDYSCFRQLPGVGEYIAAAVLSIAFNKPLAAVDGNVKRVLSRLFEMKHPVNQATSKSAYQGQADKMLATDQPGDYNQAMMELGALVCTPNNPDCETCPVQLHCRASEHRSTHQFPRRIKRKPVPLYHIAVGVVMKKEKILITLRKAEGLLGGLWEFPGGKTEPGETAAEGCIREIREETGLEIRVGQSLGIIRHAYTHFKIEMDVFICRYLSGRVKLNGPVDHKWVTYSGIQKFPFPKANHKIFPKLEQYLAEFN